MNDLIAIGDHMQSEASRVAEWAQRVWEDGGTQIEMPYEVRMAIVGVQSAIEQWTAARLALSRNEAP